MEEPLATGGLKRIAVSLKILSALQVVPAVFLLTLILTIDNSGILELAADEIMMPGRSILTMAVALLLLLIASGIVALLRMRYGWVFSFSVGTLVLLMTFLLGPGTITLTKISFFTMMGLSLVVWAQAVVYYFWDLYT